MNSAERKARAQELIRQIEARKDEYGETGRPLAHYVLVRVEEFEVRFWLTLTVPLTLICGLMWLLIVSGSKLDAEVMILMKGFGYAAIVGMAIIAAEVICLLVISGQSGEDDYEVTWSKSNIEFLENRLATIAQSIDKYAEQKKAAEPWREKVELLRPAIEGELNLVLKLTMRLDRFKAEVFRHKEVSRVVESDSYLGFDFETRDELTLVKSVDLTAGGYDDLALWVAGLSDEYDDRKNAVQKFEARLMESRKG